VEWTIICAPMETASEQAAVLGAPPPTHAEVRTPTVGVFDSGIGGFTVAREILRLRPDLNLVYYGDTVNMPYGGRPPEQIRGFARESISFLLERGMDILAVGCNASNSVLGQGELHGFGVPVFDLVSSTVDWLRDEGQRPRRLALLATVATVNSRYWDRKLRDAFPEMDLMSVAAPEFVPLVEAAKTDDQRIRQAVRKHLGPALDAGHRAFVHGCTHFPLLQSYMEELGQGIEFIDPAVCLAQRLVSSITPPTADAPPGRLEFFSSLPGEAFYRTGEAAFGRSIRNITAMYIVNPYED